MRQLTVDVSGGSTVVVCRCGWRAVRLSKAAARLVAWRHVYEAHPDRRRDAATMLGRMAR